MAASDLAVLAMRTMNAPRCGAFEEEENSGERVQSTP